MEINVQVDNDIVILKLAGNLVASVVEDLKSQVKALMAKNFNKFIFDLGSVEFMDSSGLGACMATNRDICGNGGVLVCAGLSGSVEKLFKVTRADQKVPVAASQSEALNLVISRIINK